MTPSTYLLKAVGKTSAGQAVFSKSVPITVERPDKPVSLTPDPLSYHLRQGDFDYLRISGTFSDGTTVDVTESTFLSFSSSNTAIVTVNAKGLTRAVAVGSAIVTAAYSGGPSKAVPVFVTKAAVSSSPTSLSFGTQNIGTASASQTLTVTNTSNNPSLNITGVIASGDFSEGDNCVSSSPLAVGATCTVNVSFGPTATGQRVGYLNVQTDMMASPFAVQLSGTGSESPSGPTIASLSPTSGIVNTSVTISGTNFGATQGTSSVSFHGTAAAPSSWSPTSIVVPVPNGATTGNVTVTVASQLSNAASFIVATPAPSLNGLSPPSGPAGTSVTISGANFGQSQGTSTVGFHGGLATPTSWGPNSITARVPTGTTSGNVYVTVGGQPSNGVAFTVTSGASAVQQTSNSDISGTTYTSFSATFSSATTTGNAIVLGFTYGNANAKISATDNFGNNYALATQTYDARHTQGSAILYALNIQGGASHTVTISSNASVAFLALGLHEYSGLAAASALDAAVGQTGTGTSPSSGSLTTTSNDLVFGVGVEDATGRGDTFTAGGGFTKRVDLGSAAAYADEDQMQTSAGAVSATWSLSPSSDWIGSEAAFRPPGGLSGVAHVQQAGNSDTSGATYTSFSSSFTYATTTGNAVILGVTYGSANPTITAADNEGNSYAVAQQTYDSRHNQGTAILYALNIHGGASHTVTVNFSGAVAYVALGINEYAGLATSAALDGAAGQAGSGTSLSSGTVTTGTSGDLIFGVGIEDATGSRDLFTAGSGFTKRVDLGSLAAYADEDRVQASAGAIAATWTLSASSDWIASVAAFKP